MIRGSGKRYERSGTVRGRCNGQKLLDGLGGWPCKRLKRKGEEPKL